ncbi:MAG: type II secretion system F family protein [Candidatus Taylorbacteria bacterium]|nr:type II secretion system F family protein [Candidatus Taylorbacteria bacterium]
MATYIYEAYGKDGSIEQGEFEASKESEVVEHLLRRSLHPISVSPLREAFSSRFGSIVIGRLSTVDVLFLIRNLAATIKAGMSVVESLDVLINDTEKKGLKAVLQKAQSGIKSGLPLSRSFGSYKKSFPPAFIGMLKAGEISGQLDTTLERLSQYLARDYSLKSRIRSALIYPAVLLFASSGVVALLLIAVLPRLAKSFETNKVELPGITKFFIALSDALTYSYILDIAIVALLAWFFIYFRRTDMGRKLWFSALSKAPVAKDLVKKIAVVRFARTFGNLEDAGISAVEALHVSADSIGNDVYAVALNRSAKDLEQGISLSKALSAHPRLFPKVFVGLVAVGEKTGSLGKVLLSLAEFYEEEVNDKLKDLTSVLEPILLLAMGLVVGAIALSILLPIYKLVGNFG